jgi:hypothetical protein
MALFLLPLAKDKDRSALQSPTSGLEHLLAPIGSLGETYAARAVLNRRGHFV